MKTNDSEFDRFDDAIRKILSVSHEELQKRELEWKRKRILKVGKKEKRSRKTK